MSRFAPPLRLMAHYPVSGLIALLSGAGCHDAQIDWPRPESSHGVVVMLPGIEGGAWQLTEVRAGLAKAGITDDVIAVDWGVRPFGSLINLTDIDANRRRAKRLADEIASRSRVAPGQPIQLVGFSGGGGLAMLVANELPADVNLDQLIVIAAAISPDFDVSPALRHARRGLVNFYSSQDIVVLGWGTKTLGTIDRSKTDSAGHVGFKKPDGSLREEDRLRQIAWTPDWRRLGHDGGHIGWLAKDWAREILAPILRRPANDGKSVNGKSADDRAGKANSSH